MICKIDGHDCKMDLGNECSGCVLEAVLIHDGLLHYDLRV